MSAIMAPMQCRNRNALCLLLVTAAAGCGPTRTAGGDADARPVTDSGAVVDGAFADSAPEPDGGVPGTGRIWIHGDFLIDNRYQLASYLIGDPMPATPEHLIPAADATALINGEGSGKYGAWDISPDGSRLAFAADYEVAGRFDLYTSNLDGTGLVQAVAMPTTDRHVEHVRFSPDGSRIAFTADLATSNQLDAYVVAADGELATPTRLSPARLDDQISDMLDVDDVVWADDSVHLVFTGEFSDNNFHELYIVDVTAVDPVAEPLVDRGRIASDAPGSKGALDIVHATATEVLFKARMDADNRYKLYTIGTDGSAEALLPNSEITRGDDSIADIGAFGLSPDGSQLAFAADETAGIYDVWVMPSDGSMAPTKLTTGLALPDSGPFFTQPLEWSPDGQRIAFCADFAVDDRYDLYVVGAGGGGQSRLAASPATGDCDELAWSPDSQQIYFAADLITSGENELFMVALGVEDQEAVLIFAVEEENGGVRGVRATKL